jgi:hypothetical protein
MQNKTTHKPTRSSFTLLRQLCNLIPNHLVASPRVRDPREEVADGVMDEDLDRQKAAFGRG